MDIAGESWAFTQYTVHPFDPVLNTYYAQARMYDAGDRRFMAVDIIKGSVSNVQTILPYIYCLNNPLVYIDLFGLQENPVDALKKIIDDPGEIDSFKFSKNETHYYVRDVFEILGGTVDLVKGSVFNKGSVTVSLTYDNKSITIKYDLLVAYPYNICTYGATVESPSLDQTKNNYVVVTHHPGKNKSYIELNKLLEYFKKIWCEPRNTGYTPSRKPRPTPTPTPPKTSTQILVYSPMLERFIKDYEKCSLISYDANPPLGDWTIGWGHKLHEYIGNKNNPNISWTQAEADSTFTSDLNRMINTTFVPFLKDNNIMLSQNQFDAMTSFTYNFGEYTWDANTGYETIRNFISAGDYSQAATRVAFSMYMGSRQPDGLIARRNDEIEMFLYSDYSRDYNYTRPR